MNRSRSDDPQQRYIGNPADYLAMLDRLWDLHMTPREPGAPTVISTFAGCGGSSLGYSMAGFNEVLASDWDAHAIDRFRVNFPHVPHVVHGDIADLSVDAVLEMTGLQPGELDVFDGSPPCQGFSTGGKRIMDDPRNQLFQEYVRLLRGLQPKAFVMENVSGMVKGKMRLIFAEVLQALRESGYRVSARLLEASYFNVPQMRKRLIFIGVREDIRRNPSHPGPWSTPLTVGRAIPGMTPDRASRDAYPEITAIDSRFPKLNDVYGRLWERVPHGGNATHVIGKGFNSCQKLHPDRPSPTLMKTGTGRGFGTLTHPWVPRALTIPEAQLIQSFPLAFDLAAGSYSERWARIGNSVPPLMMRAIALHIRDHLLPERNAT